MDAEHQEIWPAAPIEMPALYAPSRIKIVLTHIAGFPILLGKRLLNMRGNIIKHANREIMDEELL